MTNPWKSAASVAELGNLMADWLEGRLGGWTPGYCDDRPDEETNHLIPILAACNRAGFVTTNSQPGHPPERGYDGRMYRQRAWVEGWIADANLLGRIQGSAHLQGVSVIAHGPDVKSRKYMPITEADGECVTGAGDHLGHRKAIAYEWPGIGRDAVRELRAATHLTLIDTVWGRDNRLWPALQRAIR